MDFPLSQSSSATLVPEDEASETETVGLSEQEDALEQEDTLKSLQNSLGYLRQSYGPVRVFISGRSIFLLLIQP